MCLILIAHRPAAPIPLLVLANRDEYYDRPTAPAGPWEECRELIAGRDLASGGSWFGTRGARWASVTNIREGTGHSHRHRSRGWLVRDYLLGSCPPQDFLADLAPQADAYAGYNLLLGDPAGIWYSNNRGEAGRPLAPGIYGLSNHLLDTPWPKVVRAKLALSELLDRSSLDPEQAFAILADTRCAADSELPATGIPLEWERALSAAFITLENYGTRCSTLLQRSGDGRHAMIERRFMRSPLFWEQDEFTWEVGACGLDRLTPLNKE